MGRLWEEGEDGKERATELIDLNRQSKTLPQAVLEYTKRYNRPPPKGFEMWWQFCKKNGVKIVDDVSLFKPFKIASKSKGFHQADVILV